MFQNYSLPREKTCLIEWQLIKATVNRLTVFLLNDSSSIKQNFPLFCCRNSSKDKKKEKAHWNGWEGIPCPPHKILNFWARLTQIMALFYCNYYFFLFCSHEQTHTYLLVWSHPAWRGAAPLLAEWRCLIFLYFCFYISIISIGSVG